MRLGKVLFLIALLILPLVLMGCGDETAGDAKRGLFFKKKVAPQTVTKPTAPTGLQKVDPNKIVNIPEPDCTQRNVEFCEGVVLVNTTIRTDCTEEVVRTNCSVYGRACEVIVTDRAGCVEIPAVCDHAIVFDCSNEWNSTRTETMDNCEVTVTNEYCTSGCDPATGECI